MIRGVVNSRLKPTIQVRIRGPQGTEIDLEAVIDTGFTKTLTLPALVITALGLTPQSLGRITLADGTEVIFDEFEAEIEWEGQWRSVLVSEMGDEVLIGMRLLADYGLRIDVVPGGEVVITAIP